jgi:hypothetical protein
MEEQMIKKYGNDIADWQRFYEIDWEAIDEVLSKYDSAIHVQILDGIYPMPKNKQN